MRNRYQRSGWKSKGKLEVVGGRELAVRIPLPLAEVWEELQAEVERLTGEAGLQILRALLEDEVTRRVGPMYRPDPAAGARRWGRQPGYVVFGGQKISLERPRVRTRRGEEVSHWTTTGACSRTGGCSGRWRRNWSAGCRRGSTGGR